MKENLLEVIVNDIKDLEVINKVKVDQIEYCVSLEHGGLSPSIKEVTNLVNDSNKKVRVMLRNHYDNFYITNSQVEEIILFLKATNNLDIDGYVFGAITKDNKIDYKALEKVIKHLNGKSLTFHKAFDYVEDKLSELHKLLSYKEIKFILTSGGEGYPLDNADFFNGVKKEYKQRILMGGGVNLKVINYFSKKGFNNFHIGTAAREENKFKNSLSKSNIKMHTI